jgi:hypothetical protein
MGIGDQRGLRSAAQTRSHGQRKKPNASVKAPVHPTLRIEARIRRLAQRSLL